MFDIFDNILYIFDIIISYFKTDISIGAFTFSLWDLLVSVIKIILVVWLARVLTNKGGE